MPHYHHINKPRILVLGDSSYVRPFLSTSRFVVQKSPTTLGPPELNDPSWAAVVFTGGADIHPGRYDHQNTDSICDISRDAAEFYALKTFIGFKIPVIGICRGMQLLNVFAGGTLIQHVDGHNTAWNECHKIYTIDAQNIPVNSVHHQLCVLPKDAVMLAWASNKAYNHKLYDDQQVNRREPEAVWYPSINGIGVQFHPETLNEDSPGYKYFQSLITQYAGV